VAVAGEGAFVELGHLDGPSPDLPSVLGEGDDRDLPRVVEASNGDRLFDDLDSGRPV
jgi:hypothetical protein